MKRNQAVQLLQTHHATYYRLAFVYMKNEHDAKDMVQEMILKSLLHLHTLREEEKFLTWTKSILVNQCKKTLKKRKKWVIGEYPMVMPWSERDLDLENALQRITPGSGKPSSFSISWDMIKRPSHQF